MLCTMVAYRQAQSIALVSLLAASNGSCVCWNQMNIKVLLVLSLLAGHAAGLWSMLCNRAMEYSPGNACSF